VDPDQTLPPDGPPTIPAPPPSGAYEFDWAVLAAPPSWDGFASEELDDET
jgi:hypothetical protein